MKNKTKLFLALAPAAVATLYLYSMQQNQELKNPTIIQDTDIDEQLILAKAISYNSLFLRDLVLRENFNDMRKIAEMLLNNYPTKNFLVYYTNYIKNDVFSNICSKKDYTAGKVYNNIKRLIKKTETPKVYMDIFLRNFLGPNYSSYSHDKENSPRP